MEFIPAKTIVSGYSEGNSWFGINYNMNIYRGCSHACIYCDSRSACYRNDEFERVRAKEDTISIISRELRSKRKKGVVGTGAMSDPYNPFEEDLCLTRKALEIISKRDFGVAIATKSDLIVRDIDIFERINYFSPVLCKLTITASGDSLSRSVEPFAPVSSRRFAAIKELTSSGIYAGILLMPVLPFIEDSAENIFGIIEKAYDAGARFIYPAFGVTLRDRQREYFYKRLDERFPGKKERYIAEFGNEYSCISPRAKELFNLLSKECKKRGIAYKMKDIIRGYKEEKDIQISLFK